MRLRSADRRCRGASAVEMALVAPLLIGLIMAQLESSRLGMVAQLLTTAAREGCRVAVIDDSSLDDVRTRVRAVLDKSGISVGDFTPTNLKGGPWDEAVAGDPIQISFDVPYSSVSWLPTPYYLKTAHITVSATMNRE